MSTTVTYVGTQYRIPAYQDTGYAQGAGNLSSYLIALATGSLTLAGGTFTLTAEVDFGVTYGLKAAYYKSRGDITCLTANKGLVVTTPDGLNTVRISVSNGPDFSVTTEPIS